jgi:PST family polysaccharide transporter
MVQAAHLEKELQLKKIAFINTSAIFVSSIVGITAAVLKYEVWSLVAYQIGQSAFKSMFLMFSVKWKPQLKIPLKKLKKQIQFSVYAQIGAVLNFFSRNADDILVGRVLGSSVLGIYQMSYRMMLWPLQKTTQIIGRVMFPSLSLIQDDKERVKRIYLQVVSIIAFIVFPVIFGLFVLSSPAILYVMGEKWRNVIPIFQVLCLLGILQSISASQGWIFLSQGRTDLQFKVFLFSVVIIITSFFIGIRYGAMGVAICYTTASSLLIPIQLHIAGGLIHVSLIEIVKKVVGPFICASIMAGMVYVLGRVLSVNLNTGLTLGIRVTAGAVLYFFMAHIFRLESYTEIIRILKSVRSS